MAENMDGTFMADLGQTKRALSEKSKIST